MSDIKRNGEPVKTVQETEKVVNFNEPKQASGMIEVTRGNVELIIVKMLESVNKNLMEVIKLLAQIKDKK